MSKHILSLALALGFLGAASVHAQQPQSRDTTPPEESQPPSSGQVQPGKSPTDNATPPPYSTQDPRPATSPAEGTAADQSPPGRTPTTTDPAAARGQQMGDKSMGRDMVGASVISERKQAPVGKVVDVVFSASNQPEFVVIESAGKTVAVPYSVANANMSANKIMIDESRLQAAPKVKQGEWRSKTEGTWKKDATRYWERDQG
jgi:hypothetical protein